MKVGPIVIIALFTFNVAHPQSQQRQTGGSSHGSLAVTVTVEPSVWLVMESDGKQEVVVANAPDPKESFHHVSVRKKQKTRADKSTVVREQPGKQNESVVKFSFPAATQKFEVTHKTVMMNVTEGGKTERRAVNVTTIMPR